MKIAINLKDMVAPKIAQEFYKVAQRDKTELLTRLLAIKSPELALMFCHTKHEVEDVEASHWQLGYSACTLHASTASRSGCGGSSDRGQDYDVMGAVRNPNAFTGVPTRYPCS